MRARFDRSQKYPGVTSTRGRQNDCEQAERKHASVCRRHACFAFAAAGRGLNLRGQKILSPLQSVSCNNLRGQNPFCDL